MTYSSDWHVQVQDLLKGFIRELLEEKKWLKFKMQWEVNSQSWWFAHYINKYFKVQKIRRGATANLFFCLSDTSTKKKIEAQSMRTNVLKCVDR